MPNPSVYDLLHQMQTDHVILAYRGDINEELLEAVYATLERHLEEKKTAPDRKKKFFYILVESLQNVFHHQAKISADMQHSAGFVIRNVDDDGFQIVTGNYILNSSVDRLKSKLDNINSLAPEELKKHYQESLAGNQFSEKGGAGLGIIEMARKSGNKLNYEFNKVNEEYSFFSLAITIK